MTRSKRIAIVVVCVVAMTGLAVNGAVASAVVPTPAWSVASSAYPSDFTTVDNARCEFPGTPWEQCDSYVVTATDSGAKAMSEKTIMLSDTIPAGLNLKGVAIYWRKNGNDLVAERVATCTTVPEGSGLLVKCTIPASFFAAQSEPRRHVQPDGTIQMIVSVTVIEPATPGVLVNRVSVSGGGAAAEAVASSQNTLEEGAPSFGLSAFDAPFSGVDGAFETQAGAHPYELRTLLDLHSVYREPPQADKESFATTIEDPRDVIVDLPAGVAGSGVSAARCTLTRLASKGTSGLGGDSGCSLDTIVGHIETYPEGLASANTPIYDVMPEHGYPAELGFIDVTGTTHVLYVSLAPTRSGYVLRTSGREIPQIALTEIIAKVFGDPAASTRAQESLEAGGGYKYATKPTDTPTFTNPADCTGEALSSTVYMDSWQHPGTLNADGTPNVSDAKWVVAHTESSPPVTGCEALAGLFNPTLTAKPSSVAADSPTGLDVNLTVPQSTGQEALGTPPVKETVVTLPEGMTVDPSSANGLEACSEAQIGWQGKSPVGSGEYENFTASPPACPDTSKIGTVELETPALPSEACKEAIVPLQECPNSDEREKTPITGSIYVATPYANPFGTLLAIYIAVNDPKTGVIVKIPARVEADASTGRLTTVVPDTPQFPFSELRTHFYAGDNAALKTPASCGTYTVSSTITPWSAPQSGPPATPSGSFEINQGAGGGACAPPGFSPFFQAGTSSNHAGAFSPFSVTFSRKDGEENIGATTVTMPPGVSGVLTGIPLCGELQASKGECGEGSLIGEATTSVGAGTDPYWVHGGKVYLTGPYNNGPFGLSIVVPTSAGPFTLTGNAGYGKEVVRASLRIDPVTAQVTTVSDPLPSIIQGIPLDIRTVNVTVNRPGFLFNPTSCDPMSAGGTLTSTSGTSATVSSRFEAQGCAGLAFKPTFKVSSSGKTSRKDGASLRVSLTYPQGSFGKDANIHGVKVELPRQMPSRLPTLNHACVAATFDANPAACPLESRVGTARAVTPILPVALEGPAYFVSNGGAKFPELIMVLQGYGVTIDLHGETFISKGVTSSTFNAVPDQPVSSFELTLPQGPYSALAAPGGLCNVTKTKLVKRKVKLRSKNGKTRTVTRKVKTIVAASLVMPTAFTAQNGAVIHQNTPIEVTGCGKSRRKTKVGKRHVHGKRKKK